MPKTDLDQRIVVPVRIRRSSVARVDAIAAERGLTRSDVLRELLAAGLGTLDAKQARPAPKPGKR